MRQVMVSIGAVCGFDYDVAPPGRRTVNIDPFPGSLVTVTSDEVFGTHRPRKPSLSSSPWMRGARMEFSVHTTQRKRFLSAERANYRFFCFAKIKFQLSL